MGGTVGRCLFDHPSSPLLFETRWAYLNPSRFDGYSTFYQPVFSIKQLQTGNCQEQWHGQEQSQVYKKDKMKRDRPPRPFRQPNIRINGSQRKIILTIVNKFAWQTQIVPLGIFYFLSTQKQNHYTVPAHENVQFWQFSVLLLTAGASQWRHTPTPSKMYTNAVLPYLLQRTLQP